MKTKLGLLCAWMLMSCIQPSPEGDPGDSSGEPGQYGRAVLTLPEIPSAVLAKGAPDSGAFTFTLTISGEGMDTLYSFYRLDSLGGRSVTIDRIPAGARRVFTGRLLDSKGMATHEGSDTVAIQTGKTAQVYLFLRADRTGNAEICVEVEGMPPSGNCRPPRDAVLPAWCWILSESFATQMPARLEFYKESRNGYKGMVTRPDSTREPITTWWLENGSLSFILVGPEGRKRIYTGKFDPPTSSQGGVRGMVTDAITGKLIGDWKAYRTACQPIPVPEPDTSLTNCWKVVKTSTACVRSRGFLKMTRTGNHLRGTLGYRTGIYHLQGEVKGSSLEFLAVSYPLPQDSVRYYSEPLVEPLKMSGKYSAMSGSETGVWSAVADSTCGGTLDPDEKACPGDPE